MDKPHALVFINITASKFSKVSPARDLVVLLSITGKTVLNCTLKFFFGLLSSRDVYGRRENLSACCCTYLKSSYTLCTFFIIFGFCSALLTCFIYFDLLSSSLTFSLLRIRGLLRTFSVVNGSVMFN